SGEIFRIGGGSTARVGFACQGMSLVERRQPAVRGARIVAPKSGEGVGGLGVLAGPELVVAAPETDGRGVGAPRPGPADTARPGADREDGGGDPDEERRILLRPGGHLPGECLELVGLA